MTMLADQVAFVIGVDTHKDAHTAAALTATGGVVASIEVGSNRAGYRRLLKFADAHTSGRRLWAVEGTGSYGAGLTRYLLEREEWVAEIDRPQRRRRRGTGKSDQIDAVGAAREALGREHLLQPRARGRREGVRVLLTSQGAAMAARTRTLNQLHAIVVQAPEKIRDALRRLGREALVRRCARLRLSRSQSVEERCTLMALRSTARLAQTLAAEITEMERELAELVPTIAPTLIQEQGVGPITGGQMICSWSHRGRLHSEAAFAKLAGTSPVEASSGEVVRHRLNRGGDRQLNKALHTVLLSRLQHDPRTQVYVARRRAEGKSDAEIRRCLKRYAARHFFRVLEHEHLYVA